MWYLLCIHVKNEASFFLIWYDFYRDVHRISVRELYSSKGILGGILLNPPSPPPALDLMQEMPRVMDYLLTDEEEGSFISTPSPLSL